MNKAVVCARRIAELDPYLPVTVVSAGITPMTVDKFLDGLEVRRIGLREKLSSGKVRIDTAAMLDQLDEPSVASPDHPSLDEQPQPIEPAGDSEIVAAAAVRTPSGGNAQPWHIDARDDSVCIRLVPEYTTTMDVGYRASAVALGAATFNASAAAHGMVANVDFQPGMKDPHLAR